MNTMMMVAGLVIGSLLIVAGLPVAPVARAHGGSAVSGPMSGMAGGHEDCHTAMASMMWMMHQRHRMMGEGMMGASPESEATAAPSRTGPGDQTSAPASSTAGHEQHHPSSSPSASPGPS